MNLLPLDVNLFPGIVNRPRSAKIPCPIFPSPPPSAREPIEGQVHHGFGANFDCAIGSAVSAAVSAAVTTAEAPVTAGAAMRAAAANPAVKSASATAAIAAD